MFISSSGSLRTWAILGCESVDRLEELIDVDGREVFGEGDVLIGRQVLVAKDQHPVFTPGCGEC